MKNCNFQAGEYYIIDRYSETFAIIDAGNESALQSFIANFVQNLIDDGLIGEFGMADIIVFGPVRSTSACLINQDVPAREIVVSEIIPQPAFSIHWPEGHKQ